VVETVERGFRDAGKHDGIDREIKEKLRQDHEMSHFSRNFAGCEVAVGDGERASDGEQLEQKKTKETKNSGE
jgi:hypothetical protein